MSCCSHTPTGLKIRKDTDHRCDACRMPMAQPEPSFHRFIDEATQQAHGKGAGGNG